MSPLSFSKEYTTSYRPVPLCRRCGRCNRCSNNIDRCFCVGVERLRWPAVSDTAAVWLVSDHAGRLLHTSCADVQLRRSISFRLLWTAAAAAAAAASWLPGTCPLRYQWSLDVSTCSRLRTTVQHRRSQCPGEYLLSYSISNFHITSLEYFLAVVDRLSK